MCLRTGRTFTASDVLASERLPYHAGVSRLFCSRYAPLEIVTDSLHYLAKYTAVRYIGMNPAAKAVIRRVP